MTQMNDGPTDKQLNAAMEALSDFAAKHLRRVFGFEEAAMGKLRKQPIGPAANPLLVASHWRRGDRAFFPLPQEECALIGDVMQRKSGELYWRMVTKNGWHRRAEFCCDADAWYWID